MTYRIVVDHTVIDEIEAISPMMAVAQYVDERLPDEERLDILGGVIMAEIALLRTNQYTIEARAVPEAIHV